MQRKIALAQDVLESTKQTANIIAEAKLNYHDWTGEELALYIQIPDGNEKLRQVAVDYLVAAIQKNMSSIAASATMAIQNDAIRKEAI